MYRIIKILNRIEAKYYRLSAMVKMLQCNLGNDVIIGRSQIGPINITNPEGLTIGNHTVINGRFTIDATGKVYIGDYCHIGENLTIYSSNHDYRDPTSIP